MSVTCRGFNKHRRSKKRISYFAQGSLLLSPINEAGNEVLKNDSDKNLNKAVIKLKKILFTVIILS